MAAADRAPLAWADTLERLAEGDLAAFDRVTRVVTRYLASLGAYAMRDSWDDLVQEVLIALLRSPPRASETGAIVRHIQTTTYRKYIDAVRSVRGRRRTPAPAAGGEAAEEPTQGWRSFVPLDAAGDPPAPGEAPQPEVALHGALDALDPRERQAVECRYVLGCSNDEGAQRLEVSLATYKRLVSRALSGLRDRLEPRARGEPESRAGPSSE